MDSKKWVLLTGASTGIGRATVEYISSKGFNIYAGARKQTDLDSLNQIPNVKAIKLDISIQDDVNQALKTIQEQNTGLFAIVNNAGHNFAGALLDLTPEDIMITLNVNLLGTHRINRAFFQMLLESKGRIINIGSVNGIISMPFEAPYCMGKFAMEAYSDSLRRELYHHNIHVSLIQPGFIDTKIWEKGKKQLGEMKENNINSIFYEEEMIVGQKFMDMAETESIKPIKVAEVIHTALTAKKPRARYLATERNYYYRLAKFLPDKIIDHVVMSWFKPRH